MSSPSRSLRRSRSGRCPSEMRHCTPLSSVITRGTRSLYFWSIRSAQRLDGRSEEHTSELQSQSNLVCRLLLEKKNTTSARIGIDILLQSEERPNVPRVH